MDHFGTSYRSTPLTYAIEDEPLGTGGGLLLAAQGLKEPFIVLNGDTFFEVELAKLLKFHADHSGDWTFSLFRTSEVGRYMGIEVRSDGKIGSLTSGTGEQSRLANGGVYLVNPSVLGNKAFVPGIKLSLEDDLLPSLVFQGYKLLGLEFPGAFIDIGIPQDYFRAAEVLPH
jgi:D-glycero-alpha-D-manno-heptose 1-phosphate guanylyltransferase